MTDRLAELADRGVSIWLDDLSREHLATAALRGRAAIANARLAYQHYDRAFSSPRRAALHAASALPQRLLWASTSVKDPAYPDTRYVVELVAPGVVNAMPESTLRAVAEHGQVPADSIREHYDEAQQVLDQMTRSASITTTSPRPWKSTR
jgi:transaldolase